MTTRVFPVLIVLLALLLAAGCSHSSGNSTGSTVAPATVVPAPAGAPPEAQKYINQAPISSGPGPGVGPPAGIPGKANPN